jgi:hypothetical protein
MSDLWAFLAIMVMAAAFVALSLTEAVTAMWLIADSVRDLLPTWP